MPAKSGRIQPRRGDANTKPPREGRTAKENVDLKREVKYLKRKVAQLQKELDRMEFFVPEDDVVEYEPVERASAPACPECSGTDLADFETPAQKKFVVCRNCKWRSL